jgi:hypothetical protein
MVIREWLAFDRCGEERECRVASRRRGDMVDIDRGYAPIPEYIPGLAILAGAVGATNCSVLHRLPAYIRGCLVVA